MGVCELLLPTWSGKTSTALHGPLETSATAARCAMVLIVMNLGVLVSSWMLSWIHLVAYLVSALRRLVRPVEEERSTEAMTCSGAAGGTGVSGFLLAVWLMRETPVPSGGTLERSAKGAGATRMGAWMNSAEGRWSGRFRAPARLHGHLQFMPPTVSTTTHADDHAHRTGFSCPFSFSSRLCVCQFLG